MSDTDSSEALDSVSFDGVKNDIELANAFTARLNEMQSDHIIVLDEIGFIESDSPSVDDIKDAIEVSLFHYYGGDNSTTAPQDMFAAAGGGIAKTPAKLLPIDLKNEDFKEVYARMAEEKRGAIVFPTSESTVAFGIFSVYAAKLGTNDRDLGFGVLEDARNKNEEFRQAGGTSSALYGLVEPLDREYKIGSSTIKIFNSDRSPSGDNLRYFSPKVFASDEDKKGFLPDTALGNELKERLKKMADLKPAKGKKDNKVMSAEQGISPITQFYLMRYLGAYLGKRRGEQPSVAEQSLPSVNQATNKVELSRIQMQRSVGIDLQQVLRELIEGDLIDNKSIDDIFPFERLRTTYRYPDDYSMDWRPMGDGGQNLLVDDLIKNAVEPQPWMNPTRDTLKYGLLQKFYTSLRKKDKEVFLDAVVSQIFENIPTETIFLPTSSRLGDASNELDFTQRDRIGVPRLNGSFKIAEAMKAFSDISPSDTTSDSLKLRLDASEDELQLISDGAEIQVPGWLVLASELPGAHKWLSFITGNPNYGNTLAYHDGVILAKDEGPEHIARLVEYYTNMMVDEEGNSTFDFEGFAEAMNNEYEFIAFSDNEQVEVTLVDQPEISFMLNQKTLMKGLNEASFDVIDPNGNLTAEQKTYNGTDDDGGAMYATAVDTGLSLDSLSPSNARSFNALGYILEEVMVHVASEAVQTAENVTTVSDFDQIVLALIGTHKRPGIAVAHSIIHYQYMLAKTMNPIKNWQAIDASLFQQGNILALESFFSEPAKKTLYFLLNDKGFIDLGDFRGDRPRFFRAPQSARVSDARFVGLLNSFSLVVISYYRLLFAQVRNRQVVNRRTQAKGQTTTDTIGIAYLWREMIADAEKNTPAPDIFGLILRWFSGAQDALLSVPVWMPVLPSNMRKENRKLNRLDVVNYLKWAYSENSIDPEYFAEVAAAYHSAKALSYLGEKEYAEIYPDLVERFVEAVDEDLGHPFLFAILTAENLPAPESERPEASNVFTITNLEQMASARQPPPVAPAGPPAGPPTGPPTGPPSGLRPGPPTTRTTSPSKTKGEEAYDSVMTKVNEIVQENDEGSLIASAATTLNKIQNDNDLVDFIDGLSISKQTAFKKVGSILDDIAKRNTGNVDYDELRNQLKTQVGILNE